MNQILSVDMQKNNNNNSTMNRNNNKKTKKSDIKSIIIFFCIILILFAIIIAFVATNIMNKDKSKEQPNQPTVITGSQPTINVEIKSETSLNIIVSHDKQISLIMYKWNDGEAIELKDIGENSKEIEVEIPEGTNTLNISVTDINGVTQTYSEQHTGTQTPIDGPNLVIKPENGKIKVTAQSNVKIAYISYNWDGGEEKQIQIDDVKTEQYIEVPEGEHTLNVVLVDVEGQETTQSQKTNGDKKPGVNITTDRNKTGLFIEATDDQGLKKITVENFDTKEIKEYNISGTHCKEIVPLQTGENKLIITVYNINDIKNEKRVKVVK